MKSLAKIVQVLSDCERTRRRAFKGKGKRLKKQFFQIWMTKDGWRCAALPSRRAGGARMSSRWLDHNKKIRQALALGVSEPNHIIDLNMNNSNNKNNNHHKSKNNNNHNNSNNGNNISNSISSSNNSSNCCLLLDKKTRARRGGCQGAPRAGNGST